MDETAYRRGTPDHPWRDKALPGMPLFPGPSSIREKCIDAFGIEWTASYIDPCEWDGRTMLLICRTAFARDKIRDQASSLLKSKGIKLGVNPTPPPRPEPKMRW
jgi:hypothetical protein